MIFNATVNTELENADFSKTGLYFQHSTLDATDDSILLYRGIAELGRQNGIILHRKWRLKYRTDQIPGWDSLSTRTSLPIGKQIRLLDTLILPGTSERATHLIIPITASDGAVYGFCGFEISESYFKTYFAQATQITHLTCLFTKDKEDTIDPKAGFSAGVFNGYYLAPNGEMRIDDFKEGLVTFNGNSSYVGKTKNITVCNESYRISVMISQTEYTALSLIHI